MMTSSDALVIFAKHPDPRSSKTRLSPPLSRPQAARLSLCFLADTLATARLVPDVDRIIAFYPPEAGAYFARLAPDLKRLAQDGRDLGERMHRAMAVLFTQAYRRVVLVGSDLPHLRTQEITAGFATLRQGADVVLGPATDGGYYLVGLTRPQAQLFDLPMSTPQVLIQTVERCRQSGLELALLPENFDIDTAADLEKLGALLATDPAIPAPNTRLWFAARSPRAAG